MASEVPRAPWTAAAAWVATLTCRSISSPNEQAVESGVGHDLSAGRVRHSLHLQTISARWRVFIPDRPSYRGGRRLRRSGPGITTSPPNSTAPDSHACRQGPRCPPHGAGALPGQGAGTPAHPLLQAGTGPRPCRPSRGYCGASGTGLGLANLTGTLPPPCPSPRLRTHRDRGRRTSSRGLCTRLL